MLLYIIYIKNKCWTIITCVCDHLLADCSMLDQVIQWQSITFAAVA